MQSVIPENFTSFIASNDLKGQQFDLNGSSDVLTIGAGLSCDHASIQEAINSIPLGALNYELRVANDKTYQENIYLYTHSVKLIGGFDDCDAAAAGNANNDHAQLDGSTASKPALVIANPANYTNRQIVIERIDISGGTADQTMNLPGGGVNAVDAAAEIYLTDVIINDNLGVMGGGLYATGQSTQMFLTDVYVILNEAANGGGLYCDQASVIMYGESGVSANLATGQFLQGNGGGIYATNDCVFWLFSGTTGGFLDFRGIAGNQANRHGGGLYASDGSLVFLYGQELGSFGDNQDPVNITNNEADADDDMVGDGGGIYAIESNISAYALLLNKNQANNASAAYMSQTDFYLQYNDGGCWSETLCNQIRENTVKDVSNNDTYTILSLGNSSLDFKIHQTEVAFNRASKSSFFFNQFSNIDLAGNLIFGNGDDGLSGHADKFLISVFRPNSFDMYANTVVDNHLTEAVIEVAEASTNPANIGGSIFHEMNGIDVMAGSGSGTVNFNCLISHEVSSFGGNNIIVSDPDFVNRTNQDFHLLPTSPAIDLCDHTVSPTSLTDLDGQSRGWDVPNIVNIEGPYDAGVDEYLTPTQADLAVSITLDTAGPYYAGQVLDYTAVVTNMGPDTAQNSAIEIFTSNLSIVSISGNCFLVNPCYFGNLASGASQTFNYQLRIGPGALFSVSSSVMADEFDPDSTNNQDDSTTGVVTQYSADLVTELTLLTPPPYHHTQWVTYHAVISNNGPDESGNFTFSAAPLTTNQILKSISGGGCTGLPCTIESLANGATSETLVLVYEIDNPGSFRGSFKVDTNTFWSDPDPANNIASTEQLQADSLVDLTVSKTLLSTGPFNVGQTVEYAIQYSNTGIDGAFMASIDDTPENMTITSISDINCNAFPCAVGTLASGDTGAFTVTATIDAVGQFNNTASIQSQAGFDPNQANNLDDGSVDFNNGGIAGSDDLIFVANFE